MNSAMPLQARYTRYKNLPDPRSPLPDIDSLYDRAFEIHEATVSPIPFGAFTKIGMLYFPDRLMALGYDALKSLFWKLHQPTLYLLGHIEESSPALVSLAADLGPSGFAASEVLWWLARTSQPPREAFKSSWLRYAAPFGDIDEEWVERRERELAAFTVERQKL